MREKYTTYEVPVDKIFKKYQHLEDEFPFWSVAERWQEVGHAGEDDWIDLTDFICILWNPDSVSVWNSVRVTVDSEWEYSTFGNSTNFSTGGTGQ
jgi:hypothetical protein